MADEQAVECPQCGHRNEPVEKRCSKCGVDLEWALERGSQYWLEPAETRPPLILVSEDEPGMLELIGIILERAGYRVAKGPNAYITLELAERLHPDLIITDVMKPVMNGAEMLSHIKSNPALQDTPALLVTAVHDYWRLSIAVEAGVTRWLHKPFLPSYLIAVVASVLAGDFLPLVLTTHALPASLTENYRILTPTSHEEIFQGARQLNPDLIVIGVHLSDGSGLDILAELKADKDTSNIPVVMWFEESEPELEQQAMELGAQAVYTGSLNSERLHDVFQAALGE